MSGIYIHIPFCKKACHYCNFHFSTSTSGIERMIHAIEKEISMRAEAQNGIVDTIYFGGGTPSIIPLHLLDQLLEKIYSTHEIADDVEITLEANPDDINKQNAVEWKKMGINRFSIGIQSFFESDLKWMNRAHNAIQSRFCIETIQSAGFTNFSIDLIYGTPGQTIEQWNENLDIAFSYSIPHLSCYALTVEEGTALHKMIMNKKKDEVDPDDQAAFFKLLMNKTKNAGYRHYEISNFSKLFMESKHNSAYWEGIPYKGFGPSAHSYDGKHRSWNISHNMDYIKSIENDHLPSTIEELDENDVFNEYIMTSLRRDSGISKSRILEVWGDQKMKQLDIEIKPFVDNGNIQDNVTHYALTDEGKFFADGIASALFLLKK